MFIYLFLPSKEGCVCLFFVFVLSLLVLNNWQCFYFAKEQFVGLVG